jgi:hypothetical protein
MTTPRLPRLSDEQLVAMRSQSHVGSRVNRAADELLAWRRRGQEQAARWQPIDSAPQGGHSVIGLTWDGVVHPVYWDSRTYCWRWSGDGWFSGDAPRITHWMPMPEPPDRSVADTLTAGETEPTT